MYGGTGGVFESTNNVGVNIRFAAKPFSAFPFWRSLIDIRVDGDVFFQRGLDEVRSIHWLNSRELVIEHFNQGTYILVAQWRDVTVSLRSVLSDEY